MKKRHSPLGILELVLATICLMVVFPYCFFLRPLFDFVNGFSSVPLSTGPVPNGWITLALFMSGGVCAIGAIELFDKRPGGKLKIAMSSAAIGFLMLEVGVLFALSGWVISGFFIYRILNPDFQPLVTPDPMKNDWNS